MNLNFTVSIEVDRQGEMWVEYIRKLLQHRIGHISDRVMVVYNGWLTKPDKYYEAIEREAYDRGELEIL